ncbi:hypothetical protein PSN45_003542 [Yamadazyma tenuis]|uniref:Arrestin-like N-terminal domain-containing protein n=1 Tax=Candida tenuis (strain ATCC 10573 / BCRC 21748 / CBS 615 / JCM 9827 / NBRC 10315 / NRRL Y-1498 / VKM Y-70) TaxID=590646 RepID=G3AXR7_CANTC|nr:uncharacterized protein CANTEDRAFT_118185 [Yamadazyma tenuis ATCC 10573]XP_006684888.1 uncharacterized protein CANTEDRAFT_118185 [Yamadazyma tenuis ATCC 10573]EGV66313.1 hypothetical protein CANTEDRAFT_118185 [Yamadazyma tenuis ATCC 10573]EGV66314.1 hypothetical protein CANTEDRAFT_118185 [Yamadazyma tenuis ATCC 10573]WEJ96008.1 hypothetical protein PSN45_003542 [Yamadazyma tenuis]
MGNCDVAIEIDRATSGGTFTNYDVLTGSVKLTVTGSISLNYIQVKLEGISKTELSIPREVLRRDKRDRREKRDKILQDAHRVLYDTLIVFPPENIRQVSKAKEFTLTPGTYTYPFTFKLPLNNSCIKLSGITNKVSFNMKKLDLKINNGNFNSNMVKNMAVSYLQGQQMPSTSAPPPTQQAYHVTAQLPPSLSGLGEFASIKYFVKVTCKRSSFLKVNLRAFDPFIFLPLDLDSHNLPLIHSEDYEEYREAFVRKDVVFKNRIPEIIGVKMPSGKVSMSSNDKLLPQAPLVVPRKSFLQKLFEPPAPPPNPRRNSAASGSTSPRPQVNTQDVPFAFEIRFRHPAFLIPTKLPSFKLYLVSNVRPSVYSLSEFGRPEESNGLGVVYLQRLVMDLTSTTTISVLESDGVLNEIHKSRHDDVINICNNTYQNLKLDLMNCKRSKNSSSTTASNNLANNVYELEIPKKYFANCVLPDYLSPSFRTCNIQRKYRLTVVGGFSSEKIADFNNSAELTRKLSYVDLQINDIKVLGGLTMTRSLSEGASTSTIPTINKPLPDEKTANGADSHLVPPPKLPNRPDGLPVGGASSAESSQDSLPLPTYEDVMKESTYQNPSDHQRARRRYQQHEHYYNNLE